MECRPFFASPISRFSPEFELRKVHRAPYFNLPRGLRALPTYLFPGKCKILVSRGPFAHVYILLLSKVMKYAFMENLFLYFFILFRFRSHASRRYISCILIRLHMWHGLFPFKHNRVFQPCSYSFFMCRTLHFHI